ncbi:MAG TPA: hypothetical protein VK675_04690 [Candidatus Paceibacterota bacterium]|nr:hypothetical protein [Candidatus Paceibacterota bacterium]
MDTNNKKSTNVIFIVVAIVILAGGYLIFNRPKVDIPQASLKNKKVSELMALNTPFECNVSGLVEEARAERKSGEGRQVPTKLFIKGNTIRDEGISIFTDGKETNSVNIINPNKKTFFTLLPDGSNKMASLDYNLLGGDRLIKRYDDISPENISCKALAFDENILVPTNVCFMPPSKETPACS